MSKHAAPPVRPVIVWGVADAEGAVTCRPHTWGSRTSFATTDGCLLTVKVGNKPYLLTATTQSEHDPDRTVASEAGLLRKYR